MPHKAGGLQLTEPARFVVPAAGALAGRDHERAQHGVGRRDPAGVALRPGEVERSLRRRSRRRDVARRHERPGQPEPGLCRRSAQSPVSAIALPARAAARAAAASPAPMCTSVSTMFVWVRVS